jgi:uncharacterized cupin superfamily protein
MTLHVHDRYCDADGQSQFRDIEIELSEPVLGGVLSKPQAVSTLMFRQIPSDVFVDWHNPPRRFCAVYLDGRVQTTASDGESRVLGAGEVMLKAKWPGGQVSEVSDTVFHIRGATPDD